jgi:ribosomal protein L37AE/L43A
MAVSCDVCHKPAPWTQQRVSDGKWACYNCTDEETWAAYPGSKEREQQRQVRAERARRNFGHKEIA